VLFHPELFGGGVMIGLTAGNDGAPGIDQAVEANPHAVAKMISAENPAPRNPVPRTQTS